MHKRILTVIATIALLTVAAAASPVQPTGTEPQVIVVDPGGASVASVWDGKVNLGGRPVDVRKEGDTWWWLDELGRPRGGVRLRGGRYEIVERSGSPLSKVDPTPFGWRGDGFEVRRVGDGFEARRDGKRIALARPRSATVVDLIDETGKVRGSARGLTPDRMALWWLFRGTAEEPAWLAILAPPAPKR